MHVTTQAKDASDVSKTHLIKGSCVVETALPDFIHSTLGRFLVRTVRIGHDGHHSTPADARLRHGSSIGTMEEGRACLPGAVWRMTEFHVGFHAPRNSLHSNCLHESEGE